MAHSCAAQLAPTAPITAPVWLTNLGVAKLSPNPCRRDELEIAATAFVVLQTRYRLLVWRYGLVHCGCR